jgi:hypothetical protein
MRWRERPTVVAATAMALALAVLAPAPRASAIATAAAAATDTPSIPGPENVTQIAVAGDPVNGPLIGEVADDGTAWVQGGGLTSGWIQTPYTGVTDIAVASDPTNGPLIGVIANGVAYVEEGGLNGSWVQETGGGTVDSVSQITLASDPADGPVIGVVDTSGNAWVKDGGLSTSWVQEYSGGVTSLAVASDPTNGPLVGVLSNDTAYFKQGSLNAGWGFIGQSGAATALAVASDPTDGPLIGVIHADNAYVKQGNLTNAWTLEHSGVTALALASDSTNGPLIGVVDTNNTAWTEEGGLSAGWVDRYPNVSQFALGSDFIYGPLIGIIAGSLNSADIDGNAHVKQGGSGTGWTNETPGVNAPPNLSGAFAIASAGSPGQLLCAQDDTQNAVLQPMTLDIEANCLWQQSGPDNDAVLYNPSQNLVLDINLATYPIPSGTPVNLQPYYTDPVQSYEQFNWSGETGYGGQSLQPVNDATLNLNATALTLTGWDSSGTDPAQMSWTKVDVSNGSYPPVTMPTNPNAPPDLSGDMLIQDEGTPGYVLCADPTTSGTETLPLSQSINPYCLWQQSGPDSDAYLYNAAMNAVLDVNSSSDVTAGTTTNLQPYYTSPTQGYEQWVWSGQNGYGGRTLSPFDNTALDLNGASSSSPYLPVSNMRLNPAPGTWALIPARDTTYSTVTIKLGGPTRDLCADSNNTLYLRLWWFYSCTWSMAGYRTGSADGGYYSFNSAVYGTWLYYNGAGNAVTMSTNTTGTRWWWTLGGMESWGAQAIRPKDEVTQNLNGSGCSWSLLLGITQHGCINTSRWNGGGYDRTWVIDGR